MNTGGTEQGAAVSTSMQDANPATNGAVRSLHPKHRVQGEPYPQDKGRQPGAATTTNGNAALLWHCPRSGVQWVPAAWESVAAPATISNAAALRFLTLLGSDLSQDRVTDCARSVTVSLRGHSHSLEAVEGRDDTLQGIVLQCKSALNRSTESDFYVMLSLIRLVFKCNRYVKLCAWEVGILISPVPSIIEGDKDGKLTMTGIWKKYLRSLEGGPKKKTFQDWHAFGSKYARLAAGGTHRLLVLSAQ